MRKDVEFKPDNDDEFGNFEFQPDMNEEEEDCPFFGALMSAIIGVNKPFGILWDQDKMEEFLMARNYKILDRKNKEGEKIRIAVKKDDKSIPNLDNSNIRQTFEEEIQTVLMKWLVKLASES